ncbi:fluoride efflux transporter CrcB [Streptomyces sp. CB01881]|uniref:fluoride efflux transporter CrcB n=1 Tax=Streptomyces sp. CB01881 TaxID=2078691 RepID=UPI000CDCD289|nr:fluoride efflux transporter CrcB [Streptomyces sp. CB01881]AUY50511.1 fluoride efflux transporter CrcB [Streptomyces sp. CB01881]TYC73900.1 fluoride efflux transporter CrcB [Streptomyces sp. CB01881]
MATSNGSAGGPAGGAAGSAVDGPPRVGPGAAVPRRPPVLRGQGPAVAVVALGGAVGASARYGAALLWPDGPADFPWTTLVVNVVGCAVIGVFLVAITEGRPAHPLLRPFFGTGVLGGFTTFSTYAVDIRRLLEEGRPGAGPAYLGLTLLAALAAVWAAAGLTRRLIRRGAREGR